MGKINESLKKIRWQTLATAIALIVVGIIFIVFPASSARIICYIAGAVFLVWGLFRIIVYFASGMREANAESFAVGVALLVVALLMFVKPELVSEVLTVLFGIVLIVDGAVKLQQSFVLAKRKLGGWWALLIVALIMFVLGLVITFQPFSSANTLMIFAGVSLVIAGVLDVFAVSFYASKADREKKRSDVIDV